MVGSSGISIGGGKGWVVGWVCGRGFCGYGFVKVVLLGYLDGILLGWVHGWELGAPDGIFLGGFEWTLTG